MSGQPWSVCFLCDNPDCLTGEHIVLLEYQSEISPVRIVDDLLRQPNVRKILWLMRVPAPKPKVIYERH